MIKSDAEHIIRRAIEETGAEFTEKQVEALAIICMKIAGRLVEELAASWRGKPGTKPMFFTD